MTFISNKEEKYIEEVIQDAKSRKISISPFDIYAYISTFYNIEVIHKPLWNNGAVVIDYYNQKLKITIHNAFSEVRKRYSLAYAFGHYCLNKEKYLKYNAFIKNTPLILEESKDESDIEANKFATKLLLPKEELLNFWKRKERITVGDVARHFKVPANIVRLYLTELGFKLRLNVKINPW